MAKASKQASKQAASKSSKSAATATQPRGKLINVYLRQIDADSFENQRTGDFTKGTSSEEGSNQSFDELVNSIDLGGLKDPPTARPHPNAGKTLADGSIVPEYQLIKGFRRFAAVNLLAQRDLGEDYLETARIDLIVKDLDDLEALEENVFENSARDNLTGPDLAFAAYNLQENYKAKGIQISDNLLAKRMGKNQSYISKIKKIVSSAPKIAKLWQQSLSPLTVDAMKELSELPPDQQEPEYERLNAELAGKGGTNRGKAKPPLETATNQAKRIATMLGALELQELISVHVDWHADLADIGVKVDDLTAPDKRKVAEIAEKTYLEAKTPKAPKPPAPTANATTETTTEAAQA